VYRLFLLVTRVDRYSLLSTAHCSPREIEPTLAFDSSGKSTATPANIVTMNRQEGFHAFYKGITPRIMRVAPGQAVTFTVYEFLKEKLENSHLPLVGGKYEE